MEKGEEKGGERVRESYSNRRIESVGERCKGRRVHGRERKGRGKEKRREMQEIGETEGREMASKNTGRRNG